MRILVLIDGEHYPPVTRWGIDASVSAGHVVVGALFLGGTEKVQPGELPDVGVPVVVAGADMRSGLREAIERFRPEAVQDVSDEPVLGYRERFELVAVALDACVPYLGADFRFDPPHQVGAPLVPTVAVIGTGKRTGKTAIAGQLARLADARGLRPVVVAMGRGGPAEPQVATAGSVDLDGLIARASSGQHASSDYLEDAVTSGVTTVGARRAGGGLAGGVHASNAAEAVRVAQSLDCGLLILEGSGSAIPPVAWDAAALVAPVDIPEESLLGYLGPYRLLRSDLLVVTMATSSGSGAPYHPPFEDPLQARYPHLRQAVTDFEPYPLGEVSGATVFLASTAPAAVIDRLAAHLEGRYGCTVVASSHHLSDRAALMADIEMAPPFQILATELKAAAIDVASRAALARGARVVFLDNRAVSTGAADIEAELGRVLDLAAERATGRGASR